MAIFTEDWKREFEIELNKLSPWKSAKARHYFLSDKNTIQRNEIEERIKLFSEKSKERILKKMNNPSQSVSTYFEIIIGAFLVNSGFRIEYEESVGGKRPDWYVFANDDIPEFIVEVFYKEESEEDQAFQYFECIFTKICDDLEFNGRVLIDLDNYARYLNLSIAKAKNINNLDQFISQEEEEISNLAPKINEWLNEKRLVGDSTQIHNISFTVTDIDAENKNYFIYLSYCGNPKPLKNTIYEKVENYRKVVINNKMPFVLACAIDSWRGLGSDDLNQILLKLPFEVFDTEPSLSAFLYFVKDGHWKVKDTFFNENALNSLPKNIFKSNKRG